jgi:polar amino acid transport system substrate-binding protein
MQRPGPKTLVILICAAMLAATWLVRSSLYQRRPLPPMVLDPPEERQEAITIHYHNRRPFYMRDGNRVHGLVIDPIARAFEAAGITHVWRETPAKRQLEIIAAGEERSCGAGWFKTPEREIFARYSLPIYRDKPFIAVVRADADFFGERQSTLEHAFKDRRLNLLVKEGYSYGPHIDQRLLDLDPQRIATTADNQDLLRMIEHHRADYTLITEEEASDLLASPEVGGDRFKIVRFSDMPAGGKRYIICSKKVSEEEMARLDAAIRSSRGSSGEGL